MTKFQEQNYHLKWPLSFIRNFSKEEVSLQGAYLKIYLYHLVGRKGIIF